MKRTLICATAAAAVIIISVRFMGDDEPAPAVAPQAAAVLSPFSQPIEPVAIEPSAVATNERTEKRAGSDPSLVRYATGKYSFLFDDMFATEAAGDELRAALLEREQIAVRLNTARQSHDGNTRDVLAEHEAALAQAERRVRTLLHPTDYAVYEALRDSDVEQYQLDQYADGISNVAPLSDGNRRAILLTKLNYKRQFRQMLLDSGILRPESSEWQRQQAFASVRVALERYRDNYLVEVRQYLYDEEQYALLRNYESSEFAAEIDKLRSIAGGG